MGAAACDAGSEISPASEGRGFFCFVHLFSGKNDVLARALQDEARACGLSVDAKAYDVTKDTRNDLLKDEPYLSILNQAKYGKWDGVHAGPPRGTFSAARWNQVRVHPLSGARPKCTASPQIRRICRGKPMRVPFSPRGAAHWAVGAEFHTRGSNGSNRASSWESLRGWRR